MDKELLQLRMILKQLNNMATDDAKLAKIIEEAKAKVLARLLQVL